MLLNAISGLAVYVPFALLTPFLSINWLSAATAIVFGAPGTAILALLLNFGA